MFHALVTFNCGAESRIARELGFQYGPARSVPIIGRVNVLPFDDDDARAAGAIRANLEAGRSQAGSSGPTIY